METLALVAAVLAALITALLFALLAYSVVLVIAHRRYAHIPCPKGASFFLGHISEITKRTNNGEFLFDILVKWYSDVGPVFVWWILHFPLVVVSDTESMKVVMSRKVNKPVLSQLQYVMGQRVAINSVVLIPTYEDWKDRRRTLDSAFTRNYLRSLVPHFNTVAIENLVSSIRLKAGGRIPAMMKEEFSNAALNTISRVAFGSDFSKDPFVRSLAGERGLPHLMATFLEGIDLMIKNPLMKYYRPFTCRKYGEAVRKMREVGQHCIQQRMTALENKEEVPQDILSQILKIVQLEKNIDMEDLLDEFIVFYLAGQETTSSLLSFSIVKLLQNPHILQRVIDEIEDVVGDKELVEADDLDKLKYMHQVFEETLRLYPSAGATGREAPEGLELCGYSIPKGAVLMVSPYIMHHRAEVFDDPEKFDPDRFGPDQKRPSPYDYLPFGVGHRSCIGRVFAIMEAKVMLVHLLRTFTLTLPEDYKLKVIQYAELIQPDGKIPCTVVLRK